MWPRQSGILNRMRAATPPHSPTAPPAWAQVMTVALASLATVAAFLALARPPGAGPGAPAQGSGPPGPVGALERADDGLFRLELTGEDIAALIEEALAGSPLQVDRLGVAVEEAGPDSVGLRVDGVVDGIVDGPGLPASLDLTLRRDGPTLDANVTDVSVIGVRMPDSAYRAVDDVLDQAADLGGLLTEAGAELTGLEVEGDRVVLVGRADEPEAIEQRLRTAARQRAVANSREAPEERLGRGRAEGTDMSPEVLYVALGDSITAATGAEDRRDGFASRLHAALEDQEGTDWGYVNLAEPGATARSVIAGGQLSKARSLLAERDVGLVTVTVGSNELLALLDQSPCADDLAGSACATEVERTAESFSDDLADVLDELAAADPEAPIVVVGLYNPFSLGTGSEFEARSDQAVSRLSAAARAEAERRDASFATVQSGFHQRAGATTLMSQSPPDVHPSPLGHDVLAVAVLRALDR